MNAQSTAIATAHFELRFQSLFDAGKALAFPCDALGQVPLDELSARALENYLYARAVVGRDYAAPQLIPSSEGG
jgi:hypothetical protein